MSGSQISDSTLAKLHSISPQKINTISQNLDKMIEQHVYAEGYKIKKHKGTETAFIWSTVSTIFSEFVRN